MGRRAAFRLSESRLQILLSAARLWESRTLIRRSRRLLASSAVR